MATSEKKAGLGGELNGEKSPRPAPKTAFSNPEWALASAIHGGVRNLAPLLWEITPLGAPALVYFTLDGPRACPLPLTRPPAGDSGDHIFETLRRVRENGKSLNLREVRELASDFDTGIHRKDGLPGWSDFLAHPQDPDTPRIGVRPKAARPGQPPKLLRAIRVAVEVDVYALPLHEVAVRRGLAMSEDLQNESGPSKQLRVGQTLLNELGAWPWAHAPVGDLPCSDWQDDPEFLDPLRSWQEAACVELDQEVARARAAGRAPLR